MQNVDYICIYIYNRCNPYPYLILEINVTSENIYLSVIPKEAKTSMCQLSLYCKLYK